MESKTFDQFLRRKINNRKIAFKETDWESFNSMRGGNKKLSYKKALMLLLLVPFVGLLSGIKSKDSTIIPANIQSQKSPKNDQPINQISNIIVDAYKRQGNELLKLKNYSSNLKTKSSPFYKIENKKKEFAHLSYKNIIKPILSFNPSINSFPHSKGLSDIFSNIKDIKIPQPSNLFEGNKNKKHNPTDFEAFVATNLNMVNQEIAFSNFSIGTIVSKNIFKNIGIKTGLVYSQYGGDFGNRQYNKVLYDFGITFQTTKIKAYQLDYLEWPISISTQINRKGEAQFGVISGLLLQSHNKVSIVKTGDQNSTENYDEKGYVDAYENFDFSFTLGYSHYISKRIKLKLSGKIGIVDISKNAIFKSNSYNNINSLSFGVHFQLWP